MNNRTRIEYKGAIYHVYQRGNNKKFIFKNFHHKSYFLKQLIQLQKPMGFSIFAYAIMNNHYHILLQTNDKPLSKIMHRLNTKFTKFHNGTCEHTNHVFGNRYNCNLVYNNQYLLWLLRYIHQNPLKAKICNKVNFYKWSSDFYYRNNLKTPINIDFILNIISKNRKKAIITYKKFMDSKDNLNYTDQNLNKLDIKEINIKISIENPNKFKDINKKNEDTLNIKTLDEILNNNINNKYILNLIKNKSKKRELTIHKLNYIKEALKHQYSLKEIGEKINLSSSAVYHLINRNKKIK